MIKMMINIMYVNNMAILSIDCCLPFCVIIFHIVGNFHYCVRLVYLVLMVTEQFFLQACSNKVPNEALQILH